ncbi:hypothetical protein B0H11DRAFT_2230263 [Mycena galericulata]|nr:hypothetical protein B0H11DRAFT_2230263 [Mycena galericulata]
MFVSFHTFKANDKKQEPITGFSENGLSLNGSKASLRSILTASLVRERTGMRASVSLLPAQCRDIAFTQQMVQQLSQTLCLGGGLTNLLACTPATASLFTAFVLVSAALYIGASTFTGSRTPFGGQAADQENRTECDAELHIIPGRVCGTKWLWVNPTHGAPVSKVFSFDAVVSHPVLKKSDCSMVTNQAVVSGYTMDHFGHSWPSTLGLDGGVTDFNAMIANILPFFDAHPME